MKKTIILIAMLLSFFGVKSQTISTSMFSLWPNAIDNRKCELQWLYSDDGNMTYHMLPIATFDSTSVVFRGLDKNNASINTNTKIVGVDTAGKLSPFNINALSLTQSQIQNLTSDLASKTQVLSITTNTLSLSNGGGSVTLPITDNQTLSLTNNTLSISNGNSVNLPFLQASKGSATVSGTLLQTVYTINHGLSYTPSAIFIQPKSANAAALSWVTNITSTSFQIVFLSVPVVGTNNISFDWIAYK